LLYSNRSKQWLRQAATKPNLLRTGKRRDYPRKPLKRTAGRKDRRPEQQLAVSKITMVLVRQLWLGQLLLHQSGRVRKARPILLLLVLRVKSVVEVKNVLDSPALSRRRVRRGDPVQSSEEEAQGSEQSVPATESEDEVVTSAAKVSAGKKLMHKANIKVDFNAALLDFTF
jgi:hypothetical protein